MQNVKGVVIVENGLQILHLFYIPPHELSVTTSLSGGKGGQHVNKTNSKVTLRWNVRESSVVNIKQREMLLQKLKLSIKGELIVQADEHRSQHKNIEVALMKCKKRIEMALHKPKPRKPTKPTKSSQNRRVNKKKQRSEIKKNRRKFDF